LGGVEDTLPRARRSDGPDDAHLLVDFVEDLAATLYEDALQLRIPRASHLRLACPSSHCALLGSSRRSELCMVRTMMFRPKAIKVPILHEQRSRVKPGSSIRRLLDCHSKMNNWTAGCLDIHLQLPGGLGLPPVGTPSPIRRIDRGGCQGG